MGAPLGNVGQILCAVGKSCDRDQTLIISAHAQRCENTFSKPFATAISFLAPSSYALDAVLKEAIKGDIHPTEVNNDKTISDYSLTHYESDPPADEVRGVLKDRSFNVLVINPGCDTTLSHVLDLLTCKYTSIWCLFCRVTQLSNTWEGGKFVGPSFRGTTNERVLTNATLASNAFLVAREFNATLQLGRAHGNPQQTQRMLNPTPGPRPPVPPRVNRRELPSSTSGPRPPVPPKN